MSWFTKLCRNTGLMIHHVVKPVGQSTKQTHTVNKKVEQKQVGPNMTLRRTTIDEIEIRQPTDEQQPPADSDKKSD